MSKQFNTMVSTFKGAGQSARAWYDGTCDYFASARADLIKSLTSSDQIALMKHMEGGELSRNVFMDNGVMEQVTMSSQHRHTLGGIPSTTTHSFGAPLHTNGGLSWSAALDVGSKSGLGAYGEASISTLRWLLPTSVGLSGGIRYDDFQLGVALKAGVRSWEINLSVGQSVLDVRVNFDSTRKLVEFGLSSTGPEKAPLVVPMKGASSNSTVSDTVTVRQSFYEMSGQEAVMYASAACVAIALEGATGGLATPAVAPLFARGAPSVIMRGVPARADGMLLEFFGSSGARAYATVPLR